MSQAEHLKAHALRLLASAKRFRHGGHSAGAEHIAARAEFYLEAAASLEGASPVQVERPPARVVSLVKAGPAARASANG